MCESARLSSMLRHLVRNRILLIFWHAPTCVQNWKSYTWMRDKLSQVSMNCEWAIWCQSDTNQAHITKVISNAHDFLTCGDNSHGAKCVVAYVDAQGFVNADATCEQISNGLLRMCITLWHAEITSVNMIGPWVGCRGERLPHMSMLLVCKQYML